MYHHTDTQQNAYHVSRGRVLSYNALMMCSLRAKRCVCCDRSKRSRRKLWTNRNLRVAQRLRRNIAKHQHRATSHCRSKYTHTRMICGWWWFVWWQSLRHLYGKRIAGYWWGNKTTPIAQPWRLRCDRTSTIVEIRVTVFLCLIIENGYVLSACGKHVAVVFIETDEACVETILVNKQYNTGEYTINTR